jgi:quinoprotein glucose dehydrogenase
MAGCTSGEQAQQEHHSWRNYGGGPDQSKYIELNDITKANVSSLKETWFYPTGDHQAYQFNPIIVDTLMYVLAKNNSLVALNAKTGKEVWIHAGLRGMTRRGINYWQNADGTDRRLIFQMDDYLQEIDALTGKSIDNFGTEGAVDLRIGLGRDPKTITRIQSGTPGGIYDSLVILGSSPGESFLSAPGWIRAYNIVTGKLAWTFHTIPQPGEYGYDTWPKDAYKYIGGVNCWGEMTVDEQRGIAYIPLGSPTYDYYGADRLGSDLFGDCLVALDARTGKRLWHHQLVHHDLWDYDFSAAPQLVTVTHDGKQIDAVAVAGKNGFMFAFDRVTGDPLWPIEERPVPPSDVPGEKAWPTQPFPTVLPPFARQKMTSKDITPYLLTPEERAMWVKKIDSMQTGLFTPPSVKYATLAIPGAVGGASWGATAANPPKGIVYVRSIDWPSFYGKMSERLPESTEDKPSAPESGKAIYATNCQVCHGQDRTGLVGPSLLNIAAKVDFNDFRKLLASGKGEMPAFPHLETRAMGELYRFLARGGSGQQAQPPSGPVVATGGAPGAKRPETTPNRWNPNGYGLLYPEGVSAPTARYFIPGGWGLGYPYLIKPPWSTITAYDLNKGSILWQVPIGEDRDAAAEGGKNTGVPRSQRNGMIVTSTGVLFCTAKDGKIYAFDADTGKTLWSATLPMGTEGLPSLYEVDGRHYLVVCATSPLVFGKGERAKQGDSEPSKQGGYVVFTLPEQ